MITTAEQDYILEQAYVPEHLPHYVNAISRTESFLIGEFVVHLAGSQLIFVGYPLRGKFDDAPMIDALEETKARFKPQFVSILAPALPDTIHPSPTSVTKDAYYHIKLANLRIPKKVHNMLSRARREVSTKMGKFGREHKSLIKDFIHKHELEEEARFIFKRLPEYVKCKSALVFEARDAGGKLVAFDVAEFSAQKYAFYMFNFRSMKHDVPGTSDLLLAKIIEHARTEGKQYLNLGLGINPGITFFKKKWGGVSFLQHVACKQQLAEGEPWDQILDQLSSL